MNGQNYFIGDIHFSRGSPLSITYPIAIKLGKQFYLPGKIFCFNAKNASFRAFLKKKIVSIKDLVKTEYLPKIYSSPLPHSSL